MRTSAMKGRGRFLLMGLLALVCQLPWSGAKAQTVEYIHTDALGTPIAVTDANRVVIERSEYEPYGKLLNRPLTDGPGFTGHVQDAATGMTYMQQRYMDPGIGRFLSVDPVTANSGTGANFNRYWYANNNPYKFTDPDGRAPCRADNPNCDPMRDPIRQRECALTCLRNGRTNEDNKNTHAKKIPQNVANKVASDVSRRGRFLPGMQGKNEADTIYQNNSNSSLSVLVNASDLTVQIDESWKASSKGGSKAGATVQGGDFLVHGHVVIRARPDGTYGIYNQAYHYGMWGGSDGSSVVRNVLTQIGEPAKGAGNTPFMINYQGDAKCSNCEEK